MLRQIKDKISFISGIFFVILSFILFYEASTLSPVGAVFPFVMTTILIILSIILIIRSFRFEIKVINKNSFEQDFKFGFNVVIRGRV